MKSQSVHGMPERWAKVDKVLQEVFFVTGNRFKLQEVESVLGTMRHVDFDMPEIQNSICAVVMGFLKQRVLYAQMLELL